MEVFTFSMVLVFVILSFVTMYLHLKGWLTKNLIFNFIKIFCIGIISCNISILPVFAMIVGFLPVVLSSVLVCLFFRKELS